MGDLASQRIEYELSLVLNHRNIHRVIIDQHYREKHSESVDDALVLKLVQTLDGQVLDVEIERGDYQYFKVEPVFPESTRDYPFRLILVICIHDDYLGVINAFRVDRR